MLREGASFEMMNMRREELYSNLCLDRENNVWVAAKGGLFKFDADGKNLLFERKNPFPKKISPYCQVLHYDGKIIHAYAEEQSGTTELRIFDLSGNMLHEQFIDGKVFSLAISEEGDLYMTKQPFGEDSIIYKTSIDCPLGWDEVVSEDEYIFQAMCILDSNTLLVSTCSAPINMYSKQSLRIVDVAKQSVVKSFSTKGKNDGEVHFPRCIQRYGNDAVVLDKTGRLQRFSRDGQFVGIVAQIDAYLGNGFIVEGERAVIACSGIVLNTAQEAVCDDWLEKINLDGSRWIPREVNTAT
ncbi:Uncharacterized protein C45G9.5 [Toxocara canis]|uniref:Uncharacterized protein C45G9.5 n=1 Tax=Toxocara canis TaxID=6265 RepID=A0A0B2UTP9_TOXCA|nr:Uncharacterized protein C45G9.5 [Toxocara canis]